MKIFGICLVKNEADIIEYCLSEASKWADKIFVYDNGSEDETWEIVNDLASSNPVIIPYKKEALPFRDELRARVFNTYKHLTSEGDWWCFRLDSDEFYIDNPKDFLANVPSKYHVVAKASFDFRLTFEDVEEFEFKDCSPHDALQLKYYNPLLYTEKRFFKHRKRLKWSNEKGFPDHMGILFPKFIRQKHYQYRSPNQIQNRLEKKKIATLNGYKCFLKHDNEDLWESVAEHRGNLIMESDEWLYKGYKYPNLFKQPWYREIAELVLHGTKIFP